MATPDLRGLNILDPAHVTAYTSAINGINRSYGGGDVFTISGTVTAATTAFQVLSYGNYSLSGLGYAVQFFHISGDHVVTGAYGFRTASERVAAINVDVSVGQTVNETFGVTVSDGGLPRFRAFTYPMIYDRGEVDIYRVRYLKEKWSAGTITADEQTEWAAGLRGAFSPDDWTRIYNAIVKYQAANPGTGISATDVTNYKNGTVDRTGYLSTVNPPGLEALKNICEAIIADGVSYPGPQDFGNGKALTYQQANNVERLLSFANS